MITRLSAWALALVMGTASLAAQIDVEDFRYRAEAGVTSSKISNFGIGEILYGFRISGQVLMPFENSKWAIVSGLTFTTKGERSNFYDTSNPHKVTITPQEKTRLYYLQIPVNISHRFDLNRNNRIYFEFGPYLACAVAGKIGDLNLMTKVGEERYFNPFEIGVGASLHYDYKNIYLKGGVEYSLTAVANKDGGLAHHIKGGTPRYGLAYLTLGYQF